MILPDLLADVTHMYTDAGQLSPSYTERERERENSTLNNDLIIAKLGVLLFRFML